MTNRATFSEILTDSIALTLGLLVAFEIARRIFRWEPEEKLPPRAKVWVLVALIPFLAFGTYEAVHGTMLARVHNTMDYLDRTDKAAGAPSDSN
jgi:hypothetical protein